MSRILSSLVSLNYMVVFAFPLHADDGPAQEVIAKAIKAVGPEEKTAKLKAVTIKFKGKIHQIGMEIPFAAEFASHGVDRARTVIFFEFNGQRISQAKILNRDKGWNKIGEILTEMTEDQVKEAQEEVYENWVKSLVPLRDKAYTLSSLGDVKVDDRPTLGVRVSSKGHRDINLFFDKENFLLVKSEMRAKDEDTGMEVNQEFFNSDYKEVGGLKEATKFVIKRDGKLFLEAEVEEIKRQEKLDDSTFAKP